MVTIRQQFDIVIAQLRSFRGPEKLDHLVDVATFINTLADVGHLMAAGLVLAVLLSGGGTTAARIAYVGTEAELDAAVTDVNAGNVEAIWLYASFIITGGAAKAFTSDVMIFGNGFPITVAQAADVFTSTAMVSAKDLTVSYFGSGTGSIFNLDGRLSLERCNLSNIGTGSVVRPYDLGVSLEECAFTSDDDVFDLQDITVVGAKQALQGVIEDCTFTLTATGDEFFEPSGASAVVAATTAGDNLFVDGTAVAKTIRFQGATPTTIVKKTNTGLIFYQTAMGVTLNAVEGGGVKIEVTSGTAPAVRTDDLNIDLLKILFASCSNPSYRADDCKIGEGNFEVTSGTGTFVETHNRGFYGTYNTTVTGAGALNHTPDFKSVAIDYYKVVNSSTGNFGTGVSTNYDLCLFDLTEFKVMAATDFEVTFRNSKLDRLLANITTSGTTVKLALKATGTSVNTVNLFEYILSNSAVAATATITAPISNTQIGQFVYTYSGNSQADSVDLTAGSVVEYVNLTGEVTTVTDSKILSGVINSFTFTPTDAHISNVALTATGSGAGIWTFTDVKFYGCTITSAGALALTLGGFITGTTVDQCNITAWPGTLSLTGIGTRVAKTAINVDGMTSAPGNMNVSLQRCTIVSNTTTVLDGTNPKLIDCDFVGTTLTVATTASNAIIANCMLNVSLVVDGFQSKIMNNECGGAMTSTAAISPYIMGNKIWGDITLVIASGNVVFGYNECGGVTGIRVTGSATYNLIATYNRVLSTAAIEYRSGSASTGQLVVNGEYGGTGHILGAPIPWADISIADCTGLISGIYTISADAETTLNVHNNNAALFVLTINASAAPAGTLTAIDGNIVQSGAAGAITLNTSVLADRYSTGNNVNAVGGTFIKNGPGTLVGI